MYVILPSFRTGSFPSSLASVEKTQSLNLFKGMHDVIRILRGFYQGHITCPLLAYYQLTQVEKEISDWDFLINEQIQRARKGERGK